MGGCGMGGVSGGGETLACETVNERREGINSSTMATWNRIYI